jgi:hypothetical protein
LNCERAEEIIAAAALGAADESEQRELQKHLATGCVVCAGRFAEMEAVVAQLAELLPVEPLPPSALPRLLAGLGSPSVSLASSPLNAESPRRRRKAIRFALVAGLACVLLLVAAAGALQGLVYRYRALEGEDRVAKLTAEQDRFRPALDAIRTRDARWIDLYPTDAGDELAWGRVLWDEHRDRWFLFASGLRRAAEGKTYRLWAVAADQRSVSLGSFDPDAHGLATFDAALPSGEIEWASAIVTEESIGESSAPAGPILLAGAIR